MTDLSRMADVDAEECVLGCCLISSSAIATVRTLLDASDFHLPRHRLTFAAVLDLYDRGHEVDAVTVGDRLREMGALDQVGGTAGLIGLLANVPAASTAPRYAEIVIRHSDTRRLVYGLSAAREGASEGRALSEVVSQLQDDIAGLAVARGALPEGWSTFDDLINTPEEDSPWCVPGMFYQDSRVLFTATEGAGKSTWLRQIAACVSQGRHPCWPSLAIPALPALVLDCENPRREQRRSGHVLRQALARMQDGEWNPETLSLFRRPGGFDLRTRHARTEFEAVLRHTRPKLVVGGPIYRMGPQRDGEQYDAHALALQEILHDFRVRYGFALVLEAHAAKGEAGPTRDLRPKGSSLWMAWPDVAYGLCRVERDGSVDLVPLRQDRGAFDWPDHLDRGTQLPWEAKWERSPAQREASGWLKGAA